MFSQKYSLIRRINDNCIFQTAILFQCIDKLSDGLINGRYCSKIIFQVFLVCCYSFFFKVHTFCTFQFSCYIVISAKVTIQTSYSAPRSYRTAKISCCQASMLPVFKKTVWNGNVYTLKQILMPLMIFPEVMRSLVMTHNKKRTFFIPVLQPFFCHVCNNICYISIILSDSAIFILKTRIVVISLFTFFPVPFR